MADFEGRASEPERAVQLATQSRRLLNQVMETLNRAEEELKKTKLYNRTKAAKKESAVEVIDETEADAAAEVEEQVTFTEMKEIYEAVKEEAAPAAKVEVATADAAPTDEAVPAAEDAPTVEESDETKDEALDVFLLPRLSCYRCQGLFPAAEVFPATFASSCCQGLSAAKVVLLLLPRPLPFCRGLYRCQGLPCCRGLPAAKIVLLPLPRPLTCCQGLPAAKIVLLLLPRCSLLPRSSCC